MTDRPRTNARAYHAGNIEWLMLLIMAALVLLLIGLFARPLLGWVVGGLAAFALVVWIAREMGEYVRRKRASFLYAVSRAGEAAASVARANGQSPFEATVAAEKAVRAVVGMPSWWWPIGWWRIYARNLITSPEALQAAKRR